MRYTRPQITTIAGEQIVDSIGPATAATSGASIPVPSRINVANDGGCGDVGR